MRRGATGARLPVARRDRLFQRASIEAAQASVVGANRKSRVPFPVSARARGESESDVHNRFTLRAEPSRREANCVLTVGRAGAQSRVRRFIY